ncbi:MAG: FAD-linked oxidase C-terminal domain-containing protein [Anaerolineae bacterium]|nr:FAD-linked oxidase C-terminal domain-containing protein [Anaerolineae bacterium]
MIEPRVIKELEAVVGKEYVLSSPEDLIAYSYDSTFEEHKPDIIVSPANTEEVSQVMRIAYRENIPVVPRGMGSGLAAASIPYSGGMVLNLTRLNRILEIDQENMIATVEAGVVTADFQATVEEMGLFYPPDPSSIKHSTIGGNIACNAGGPRCLKYGVTSDYVLGLTAVLPNGDIIKTGGKAIKNVTGLNLTQLLLGSEGTLAVITEALLRLMPKPKYARTAMAVYADLDDAAKTVNAILLEGVVPATIELMDDTTINTIEEYLHLGLPTDAAAILIIETDGSDEQTVLREMETVARVARECGATDVRVAKTEAERNELWRGRRSVSPSLARRRPNKLGEDISVPRSAIPEAIRRIKAISAKYNLPIVVFGHAGDGNLHPNILFDKRDPDEWLRVEQVSAEIFGMAVELGGTLTGEHGVGVLKQPYLELALGKTVIALQQGIKKVFDPKGLLNPGKKFPSA